MGLDMLSIAETTTAIWMLLFSLFILTLILLYHDSKLKTIKRRLETVEYLLANSLSEKPTRKLKVDQDPDGGVF